MINTTGHGEIHITVRHVTMHSVNPLAMVRFTSQSGRLQCTLWIWQS